MIYTTTTKNKDKVYVWMKILFKNLSDFHDVYIVFATFWIVCVCCYCTLFSAFMENYSKYRHIMCLFDLRCFYFVYYYYSYSGISTIVGNHVYRRASVRIEQDGEERTAIIELHPTNIKTASNNHLNITQDKDDPYPEPPSAEENHETDFGKDWRRVAEVLDRLFFWLFLLAILISTLVLFHPLSDAYLQSKGILAKAP